MTAAPAHKTSKVSALKAVPRPHSPRLPAITGATPRPRSHRVADGEAPAELVRQARHYGIASATCTSSFIYVLHPSGAQGAVLPRSVTPAPAPSSQLPAPLGGAAGTTCLPAPLSRLRQMAAAAFRSAWGGGCGGGGPTQKQKRALITFVSVGFGVLGKGSRRMSAKAKRRKPVGFRG